MNESTRQAIAALALAVLVVTAGCSALTESTETGGDAAEAQANPASASERLSADAEAASEDSLQARNRSIIRTGEVQLRVEDFDAVQENLTTTVKQFGGFVSDTNVDIAEVDNETYKSGQLVLRVPREEFSTMIDRAKAMGELKSVNTQSEDVTDQLVDLEARLANLRAERDRLRTLYDNASDTEAVLAVQQELSDVQQEIEQLEAEQQSLERQVALSTIAVRLDEPRPDEEPEDDDEDDWTDSSVIGAFLDSIGGVITSLQTLVLAGAYGLPYLLVYGSLLGGVVYGLHRWQRNGDDESTTGLGAGPVAERDDGEPSDVDDE